MRYILDPLFTSEVDARIKYLYKTFHLYFVPMIPYSKYDNKKAVLISFPFCVEADICMICGHNNFVACILQNQENEIYETNIYIISCAKKYHEFYNVSGKNVFIVNQMDEYAYTYYGKDYGFGFDITDSELNMYNCKKVGIRDILQEGFIPL